MTTETPIPPSPVPSAPSAPRLRASDAEREETVARLHRALGEGRLDLAEAEPRVAAAYAAQYRDELPPLLADLPDGGPPSPLDPSAAPRWAQLWVSVVWRLRATLLGAGDRPTAAQCRTAAWLLAVAMLWTTVWAVVGAAMVG